MTVTRDVRIATQPHAEVASLAIVGTVLVRGRRLVVWLAAAAAGLAILFSIVFAHFTATSQFAPVADNTSLQGLAGVAAQFGFNIGGGQSSESPDFYVALVQSRELLSKVVLSTYAFPIGRGRDSSGTLIGLMGHGGRSRDDSVLKAVTRLRDQVTVKDDQSTGIVTVTVPSDWPEVAVQINRRIIDLVNQFNVEQLQSQAGAERKFVESRMVMAQAALDSAEDGLRAFLERNKTYQTSPRLVFEEQRLQARVDLRQQVYTTLAQSYEQARIAEVRNTPQITVIDPPEGSAERKRHLARNTVLGLIGGMMFGLLAVLVRFYASQEQFENPLEVGEFRRALAEMKEAGVAGFLKPSKIVD